MVTAVPSIWIRKFVIWEVNSLENSWNKPWENLTVSQKYMGLKEAGIRD